MAFIMQSQFKLWSATHHIGHLILAEGGEGNSMKYSVSSAV